MSTLLFNLDDQLLILIITVCVIHAVSVKLQQPKKPYHGLLAAFLLAVALAALDTLLSWSNAIKQALVIFTPHLFFVTKWSWFLQGPLLYLFAKSVVYADYKTDRKEAIHFLPALLSFLAIPLLYNSLGQALLEKAVTQYHLLYANPMFLTYVFIGKCLLVAYGIAAYRLLNQHATKLEAFASNPDGIDGAWLKMLLGGFLCLWMIGLTTETLHQFDLFLSFANAIGLMKNYLEFFLINILAFMSLSRAGKVRQRLLTEQTDKAEAPPTFTEEQVARLEKAMVEDRLYLDPDLSLEQLSDRTSLPQRQVSVIINRHFEKNFFEYINHYRVNHAKTLLSDQSKKWTMLQVMAESGFNSKSAYNRLFRKFEGVTPTEYREKAHAARESTTD